MVRSLKHEDDAHKVAKVNYCAGAESFLEQEVGGWLESLQIFREEISIFSSVFKKEKQEL